MRTHRENDRENREEKVEDKKKYLEEDVEGKIIVTEEDKTEERTGYQNTLRNIIDRFSGKTRAKVFKKNIQARYFTDIKNELQKMS